MTKLVIGGGAIWRELDPSHVPGEPERFVEHEVIVNSHGDETDTEIEVPDGRVLRVHRDSLRELPRPVCLHPEHRLGTHGRLKSNQRVCMTCGDVVLVRRR